MRCLCGRVERLNPSLNGLYAWDPESAIRNAGAADSVLSRGETAGPLHGIPFTVKDVYEVGPESRLIPATGISPGNVEKGIRTSAVVRKLREAGAILLGVSRATLWSDREQRFGPARNPYDLARTPGGSSGGEAVLISSGCSPFGFGSDSGGSLRQPAHYCGIATLRPSNGRIARATDAEANDPRTAAGPIARSVQDIDLLTGITSGFEWSDPSTVPLPWPDYRRIPVKGLRIAMHLSNGIVAPTPETAECVRRTARVLEQAGAIVEERIPPELGSAWEITLEYWRFCGKQGSVEAYFKFQDRWERYRRISQEWMAGWDLILCPVEAYPRRRRKSATSCRHSHTLHLPAFWGGPAEPSERGCSLTVCQSAPRSSRPPWRDDIALACMACLESGTGGYVPPAVG